MFNLRSNDLQITMLLVFEIFGHARSDGKMFLKLCQTSFSGIVHSLNREAEVWIGLTDIDMSIS